MALWPILGVLFFEVSFLAQACALGGLGGVVLAAFEADELVGVFGVYHKLVCLFEALWADELLRGWWGF